MLDDPRVSACVVLYHAKPEVMETLRCLYASRERVTVFVADNSPGDATAAEILKRWPQTRMLTMKGNVGFGRANNAVIPHLNTAYHLICNPDVVFDPELIGRMVRYMDAHRDIVILTPRVFNPDGTEQFLPKRRPTVRYLMGGRRAIRGEELLKRAESAGVEAEMLDAQCRKQWKKVGHSKGLDRFRETVRGNLLEIRCAAAKGQAARMRLRGERLCRWRREYTLQGENVTEPMEVQFATGCFLLIRSQAFYRLGGFDERFFLYQEDSDLTLRALRLGKVVYHPDMCVTHVWSRDSQHDRMQTLQHIRSTLQFFRKWGWKW